jgi:intraflagellar transport protein 172
VPVFNITHIAIQGSKMYIATDMVFSPDSTKLAIAQSDEIIFVYNLG